MHFVENSKKALEALERKNMKQSESNQVRNILKLTTFDLSFSLGPGPGKEKLDYNGGYRILNNMTKIKSIDCKIVMDIFKEL